MIELYVDLVINGRRTCDEKNKKVKLVPKHLRVDVMNALKEKGYDGNGKEIK